MGRGADSPSVDMQLTAGERDRRADLVAGVSREARRDASVGECV